MSLKQSLVVYSVIVATLLIAFVVINAFAAIKTYKEIDRRMSNKQINVVEEYRIYVIDCKTEVREGDMQNAKLYDPFGNWRQLSFNELQYQLQHGGRLVECK